MSLLKPYASLSSLLFTNPTSAIKSVSHSLVVRNSLKILIQIKNSYRVPNISIYTPICHNHAFTPASLDSTFTTWSAKGIKCVKDLYLDNKFASFEQLRSKYNLPHSNFFRYMQIRHFVREGIPNFEFFREGHQYLELLSLSPDSKNLITKFVDFTSKDSTSTNGIKKAWEKEINTLLSDNIWRIALSRVHRCSVNSRHSLIQFKVIHRFHYSKFMLHKFYPSVSQMWDKCKSSEGTLLHLFWDCPAIQPLVWLSIFSFFF